MYTYVHLSPTGRATTFQADDEDIATMRGVVDGPLEGVGIDTITSMLLNSDSKPQGRPRNVLATKIAHSAGAIRREDVNAGDDIFTGPAGPEGETLDADLEHLREIFGVEVG